MTDSRTMNSSTDPYRFLRKKVAVVGSGSAGIGALWALNKTYHDVYVYEASDRLGGHTNTVDFSKGKFSTKVDTGFHVLNAQTSRESALLVQRQRPCVIETHIAFLFFSQLYPIPGKAQYQNRPYTFIIQCISGLWRP